MTVLGACLLAPEPFGNEAYAFHASLKAIGALVLLTTFRIASVSDVRAAKRISSSFL